jgi:predicted alpha/beta hydrolase family esterase
MTFNSTIIIVPGLGSSGPQHWQTLWEKRYNFARVEQKDWETPVCSDWVAAIQSAIEKHHPDEIILVGHSLACIAIAYWSQAFNVKIKYALLVAPADSEADTFPPVTSGFSPVPLSRLPFPSTVVTSTNDDYVTVERAKFFANCWGSESINIGKAGHINVSSGYGEWDEGLAILQKLDQQ